MRPFPQRAALHCGAECPAAPDWGRGPGEGALCAPSPGEPRRIAARNAKRRTPLTTLHSGKRVSAMSGDCGS